ncbi:DUF2325 domain-containing protein [Chitinilyticum litopenaei]|uniref:DUF2325 domain-containing protein n=1 Tax=Chitinilyticum litopenaei TaxID=1121276 RepID=UPI0004237796|nr:DUF2325 domain-containing protein [Chitinilyticum litopenaei]
MNAYLVGADVLGNIPDLLAQRGIRIQHHVSGRNVAHQRRPASLRGADLLILFTDFLSHNVMRAYRELAQEEQIRFVACRRSVCALSQSLDKLECSTPAAKACESCPKRKNRH